MTKPELEKALELAKEVNAATFSTPSERKW